MFKEVPAQFDFPAAEQEILQFWADNEIYEKSLKLAQDQLKEAQERVKVGRLAETELAAARAEVALRQEALIDARSQLDTARLLLLRLTNPPGPNLWRRQVVLKDVPAAPDVKIDDVEDHVRRTR